MRADILSGRWRRGGRACPCAGLTDQEGQRLQQIVRRGGTSSVGYRRALMLFASAGGNRVPVTAKLVQADEETVRDVMHRRGTEHGSGLGKQQWLVERMFARLHWFRRLRIRWEIRHDIHGAYLTLGCAPISRRRLRVLASDTGLVPQQAPFPLSMATLTTWPMRRTVGVVRSDAPRGTTR